VALWNLLYKDQMNWPTGGGMRVSERDQQCVTDNGYNFEKQKYNVLNDKINISLHKGNTYMTNSNFQRKEDQCLPFTTLQLEPLL